MHDVAELAAGIALCPVLAVVADIEVVFVDSTAQVLTGNRSIAETLYSLFLAHIHNQSRETFRCPARLALAVESHGCIGTNCLPLSSIDMT